MISFYKEAYHVNGRTFKDLTTAINWCRLHVTRTTAIMYQPPDLPAYVMQWFQPDYWQNYRGQVNTAQLLDCWT